MSKQAPKWAMRAVSKIAEDGDLVSGMEMHHPDSIEDAAKTIAAEFDKTGLVEAVKAHIDRRECNMFDMADALARTTEVEDEQG